MRYRGWVGAGCVFCVVVIGLVPSCAYSEGGYAEQDAGTTPDAGTAQPDAASGGTGATSAVYPDTEEIVTLQRGPTPCLDERDPDAFDVRQVNLGAGGAGCTAADCDEPSAGLVIFDKSGSMSAGWALEEDLDAGNVSDKWQAAGDALVGALQPVAHRVTLGAILFSQPSECLVAPIDDQRQFAFRPGESFIDAWVEALPLNEPGGNTPLGQAMVVAEAAIEAACVDGLLEQRFFVMALTDGMPNCGTDMDQVESIARDWLARGIPTYVFGLPGSEDAAEVLDRISAAGGTETLLVPGSPADLEGGMLDIF
jgi:hypothetical protein